MEKIIEEDLSTIEKNLIQFTDKMKDKRILITGGAGFLGSWLCDILNRFGAEITCLDNLSTSSIDNIKHLLDKKNFRLIKENVSSFKTDEKFDYIIHMASRAEPKDYPNHPLDTMSANSIGTLNMLELAKKSGVKCFLFTSTSEIYGDSTIIPTPETYPGNVSSISVRSCYDESKRFGESLCMAFFREHKLPVVIARIFNTYGPRLRGGPYGRAISSFIEQTLANKPITIFGDGQQTRSFCYITDQIEGIFKLLVSSSFGEVFNIGNDREIKIMELANLIKKLTKSKSEIIFGPLPEGDPKRRRPDLTKTNKILNYYPEVGLEDGLKRTIGWIKSLQK